MKNPAKPFKTIAFVLVLALVSWSSAFGEVKRYTIPLENAVFLGPDDAPITIIEFLDFQ